MVFAVAVVNGSSLTCRCWLGGSVSSALSERSHSNRSERLMVLSRRSILGALPVCLTDTSSPQHLSQLALSSFHFFVQTVKPTALISKPASRSNLSFKHPGKSRSLSSVGCPHADLKHKKSVGEQKYM